MVVRLVEEAKAEVPDLRVEEVDVTEHPVLAVQYRVLSTPAIAINGRLEFQGVPRAEALLSRLRAIAAQGPEGGEPSRARPTDP